MQGGGVNEGQVTYRGNEKRKEMDKDSKEGKKSLNLNGRN